MVHIILAILRIIGIILLIVLGIAAALILLVLFWPVEYQIRLRKEDQPFEAEGRAGWLFHFLSADVQIRERTGTITLKVFGRRLKTFRIPEGRKAEKPRSQEASRAETVTRSQEASRAETDGENAQSDNFRNGGADTEGSDRQTDIPGDGNCRAEDETGRESSFSWNQSPKMGRPDPGNRQLCHFSGRKNSCKGVRGCSGDRRKDNSESREGTGHSDGVCLSDAGTAF